MYVGYLEIQHLHNEVALQADATHASVPDVAVVQPKPAPPTLSMTLPGNISAWYEAPIYAQVSGYVKMWYKDYGAPVKKGMFWLKSTHPDWMHNMLRPKRTFR